MLDDGDGGARFGIELGDQLIGRVGVVEIVVGELLALELRRGGDAGALLVRCDRTPPIDAGSRHSGAPRRAVPAITRVAGFGSPATPREPARDRRVVGGGAREGLGRERSAQGKRRRAAMAAISASTRGIVGGLGDDGDAGVVLGAGADQRRAADVDSSRCSWRSRRRSPTVCLEGIEIDHEQIDRRDRVLFERALVAAIAAHARAGRRGCSGAAS